MYFLLRKIDDDNFQLLKLLHQSTQDIFQQYINFMQRQYSDSYGKVGNTAANFNSQKTNNGYGRTSNLNEGNELDADITAYLKYASGLNNDVLISGSSQYSRIAGLKNAILELRSNYFNPNSGLSIQGQNRDQLDRRFLLIEHELDGLLRRKIEYSAKDFEGGSRSLDFTTLLNEKENQIVELQKRIQNLENRLKRANENQIQLQNKIVALKAENLTLRDKSYTGEKLEQALKRQASYDQALKDLQTYKGNFAAAVSLWNLQLSELKAKYPNDRFTLSAELSNLLQRSGVSAYNTNGFTTIETNTHKTVQVPVQDSRTKHLIYLLATNLRKLSTKYPKLSAQFSPELAEFFQQELIDVIEADQLQKIVEIVKFVPQAVRVENVYAYSSSKSRRVEFHLRVLLKALLQELGKVKNRYGAVLDIDEGVIGLINQQILDIVSVDDILKVFRTTPKIVEVEKIIERVVERIVQVPQVIPIEKYIEKIVEVPRFVEIEKIVHVPVEIVKVVDNIVEKLVEVPTITEKVVEVPTFKEKIVQNRVQVPKIVEVEKIVEKIVVNNEVNTIQVPVYYPVPEIKEVVRVEEKAVPYEKIVEKIVEVPVYVEKIVEKIIEVPKIVEIQVIKEKIIAQRVVQVVGQTSVAIKQIIKEIPVYIDRIVPVETIVQKFVEVTKVIQKPVPVRSVETVIKEVEVIKEKLVPVIQIKEVERVNNVIVEKIVEVEKIVDRRVQVPIIQEKIVKVPEEIIKVVIEKVHVPQLIPVQVINEKIVYQTKIIQVEKPIVQYIKDIQVVKCEVEKIVEVPRTVERIKQVKVRIDKIVEKLVQVPKVVEVEKIVEKIVVVPRVIEKIVEVPQIVEVIVEKLVERETVREVQVSVEKIVEVEKPVEVEKVKNVYIQIEKPVERIVEKPVPIEKIVEKKEVIDRTVDKIVTVKNEVPKEIIVEKIVPKIVEKEKIVEVQKPCTLVVEVPVEVQKIIEKAVKVVQYQQKIVTSVEVVEKPVPAYVKQTQIVQVEKVVEKIVQVERPSVLSETRVVVQEKIVEVPQIIEKSKIVTQNTTDVKVVQQVIEKIVERLVEIPKLIPVEINVEKFIDKVQIVQLEKIVPVLVKVNEIVQKLVNNYITVDLYHEVPVQVPVIQEKIVQVAVSRIDKESVECIREKVTEVSKMVTKENITNRIETEVQVVDRVSTTEVPVYTTVEKIVEVPQVLEKIVERIVILPQVVEVLKYIHEISESDSLGVALQGDVAIQQARYKELYGISRRQLDLILVELRKLRQSQPALSGQIELLERYLTDFDRLAAAQRIVAVDRDRPVERDVVRSVLVPTTDSETLKSQLSLSLLVEKLLNEIKRIKKANPNVALNLDSDLGLIFFPEFYTNNSLNIPNSGFDVPKTDLTASLGKYTQQAIAKLQNLGGNWTTDHELMLFTILEERFAIGNLVKQANTEIERSREISDSRARALRERQNQFLQASKLLEDTQRSLNDLLSNNPTLAENAGLRQIADNLNGYISSGYAVTFYEPISTLGDFVGSGNDWSRVLSYARERQAEIELFKRRIYDIERSHLKTQYSGVDTERTLAALRAENASLVKELDRLKSTTSIANNSANREKELEIKLRTANARIQELQSQLRTSELKLKQLKDTKSSAASSAIDPNSNLVSSQYSSSSSTDKFGGKKPYETPSYGVNSSYSDVSSSDVKPSYGQPTTSNIYGTSYSNTTYQSTTSKLTSSGRDPATTGTTGGSTGTYGNTGVTGTYGTSGTYGTTTGTTGTYGVTGTYGNTNTTGGSNTYGNTPTGTTGTTVTSGSTGLSGTYGTTGGSTGLTGNIKPATGTGLSYGGNLSSQTGVNTLSSGLTGSRTGSSTGLTSGSNYGTGATYGSSTGNTYGNTSNTYGASGAGTGISGGATYGGSGATSSSFGSGVTGTFGSGSSSISSSLTSSGLKSSTTGTSGYQFQTKKY